MSKLDKFATIYNNQGKVMKGPLYFKFQTLKNFKHKKLRNDIN